MLVKTHLGAYAVFFTARILSPGPLIVLMLSAAFCVPAQNPPSTTQDALTQQLNSQFVLTKMSADKTNIVTAGSVLVLQKDGLLMYNISAAVPPMNTYKKGKISQGFGSSLLVGMANGMNSGSSTPAQKKLVTGEKFWVTGVSVVSDGVIFQFITDPYDDGRYYANLKFPFPKRAAPPPADEMLKTIAEVITVQPTETAGNAPQQSPAPSTSASTQTPAAPSEAPPPPIAPPPPPPADPKVISLNQTTDQVVANLGQPDKIIKLGSKQIYVYKDLKVTFVGGKVTDVQ